MSLQKVWVAPCACKRDVAAVVPFSLKTWVVHCAPDLGGCDAVGPVGDSESLAVAAWNGAAGISQYLVAAAARRAMAEGVGE